MNDYIINKETKSHEMVRYWMIYVNQIMCKEVKKIYRCNPPPSHIKFNLLQEYIKFHTNIDSTIDCNDRNSIIKFTRDYNNDKLLEHIPEINHLKCTIESISFEVPIDSSNMNPEKWVEIAQIIEENFQIF